MILHAAQTVFSDFARVTLLGSRANDQAKGGDIDLMVEVPNIVDESALFGARVVSQVSRATERRRVAIS